MVRFPAAATLSTAAIPGNSQPSYLSTSTDPNTGAKITRIADQTTFSTANKYLRHDYAKKQPWNADGTMFMLTKAAPRILLDGNSYAVIDNAGISYPSNQTWWNTDRRYIFGVTGGNALVRADMTNNGSRTTIHTFTGKTGMELGAGEGNPDNADRYVPLIYSSDGGSTYDFVVWDMVDDAIEGQLLAQPRYDWLGISQLGQYAVVQYGQEGSGAAQGTKAYNLQMGNVRHLTNGAEHGDLGIDRNGDEVYVCANYLDPSARVEMIRLADGTKTVILPEQADNDYWQGHVSCRNLKRPGWCYLSSTSSGIGNLPGDGQIFAIELKAGGEVQPWCHTHSNVANRGDDSAQAQAVPNRDGSRVAFASDWGGTSPVYGYVAEMLREDAAGPLGVY